MDNLNDIVIFVKVVGRKSFTLAAKELNLSLPYVSKRVRLLEDSLKTQLIIRSTRHLSLTEAGQMYYDYCLDALAQLSLAHEKIADLRSGLQGSVRVYSALGFGQCVLAKLVLEFNQMHPDASVQLNIGEHSTNPTEKGVDIVIRSHDLVETSLISHKLGQSNYYLCAAPQFLKKFGTPEKPQDLSKFNCLIHTGQHPSDRWEFAEGGQTFMVRVGGNLYSNNGVVVHYACEQAAGIARLPDYMVKEAVESGRLVLLFPDQLKFSRVLRAFCPRSLHIPANVQAFLDFLQSRVEAEFSLNETHTQKKVAARPRA